MMFWGGCPNSPYIFTEEQRGPLTDSTIRKMVARAGVVAGLEFPVHPHMLRHVAGYKLVNDGQDTRAIQHYLGHKNISHPATYRIIVGAVQGFLAGLTLLGRIAQYQAHTSMLFTEGFG